MTRGEDIKKQILELTREYYKEVHGQKQVFEPSKTKVNYGGRYFDDEELVKTAVKLKQDKGILDIGGDNAVKSFREKNLSDGAPINAGYMVLEPEIFKYLKDDDTVLEKDSMRQLVNEGQLMSYIHEGFWQCMDNIREKNMLENLLKTDNAPWKRWEREIPKI